MAGSPNTIQKYKSLLKKLLPQGKAWISEAGSTIDDLFGAMAVELCRVDDRVNDLLGEADPRTTVELLTLWERMLALPDECTPEDQDASERRNQIVQKLTAIGALNEEFYEFLGLQLGFVIDVVTPHEFVAGSNAGDLLFGFDEERFEAGDNAGEFLTVYGWKYFFLVYLPATAAEFFVAGSNAGDFLATFENPLIECTIKKLKPAHTGAAFVFT